MAGITLAIAQARLTDYLAAEEAILLGQQYTTQEGRQLTRADLHAVQQGIALWDARVKRLTRGGMRIRGITPV